MACRWKAGQPRCLKGDCKSILGSIMSGVMTRRVSVRNQRRSRRTKIRYENGWQMSRQKTRKAVAEKGSALEIGGSNGWHSRQSCNSIDRAASSSKLYEEVVSCAMFSLSTIFSSLPCARVLAPQSE